MKLLPIEQQKRVNETLPQLIDDAKNGNVVTLYEPCNCGSQVRHNNGGNYHEIVSVVKDKGKWYKKEDSTCELTEPSEWFETKEESVIETLKNALIEGWY